MPEYGYAGQILKVDLSSGKSTRQPSADYTDRFIGGHGVAARLYWEMVSAETRASDPENCLIAASGPVAGFPGFAGGRWKLCGKTILDDPESFSHCNLGERWGSILKFAGYDALAVQGKADNLSYLYIHDDKAEIRDAAQLKGMTTFDTIDSIKGELGRGVSVLAIGPTGENLIPFSIVLAEGNASGSGGMGALMGSKNLKAIAVAGDKRPKAANPERVRQLAKLIRDGQPKMEMPSMWGVPGLTQRHACYGCGIGCSRESYIAEKGRSYKALCQATEVYLEPTLAYYGKKDGAHLLGTRLCDGYGLDSVVMQGMLEWLEACYKEGLINEKNTGLPLSKIGSPEYIRELTRKIAYKDGFGATLAKGTIAAAGEVGQRARDMLHRFIATRGSEKKDYDPRLLISTALCYATEPRRFIHQLHELVGLHMAWIGIGPEAKPGAMFSTENYRRAAKKLWGSELAADYSTYEGKAMAAKMIQDHVYAKECLVVCDLRWTVTELGRVLGTTPDTVNEAQIYSAVTGKDIDKTGLMKIGERVFNLQRAIMLRQGREGRKGDRIMEHFFTEPLQKGDLFFNADGLAPGKDGEIISRVGETLERDKFEQMKTEYYELRGWDAETGYPTKAKLQELKLDDIATDLAGRGLVK